VIILAPFAKAMRNGQKHPKDYPWWPEVIDLASAALALEGLDARFVQVGSQHEQRLVPDFRPDLSLAALADLTLRADAFASVDSFYQHFAWDLGLRGVVVFSQSDPHIFGHPEHVNLLQDRKHLREQQFWLWEQATYKEEAFVKPQAVAAALVKVVKRSRWERQQLAYHGSPEQLAALDRELGGPQPPTYEVLAEALDSLNARIAQHAQQQQHQENSQ
jgi:hypothetical protein